MAQLGFTDQGDGEPVIWLHSSGTSKRQWRRLIDALPGGYRSLAVDLWGYGDTPMPDCSNGFSLSDEAALAEQVFERFDGPCRLVGHSYGGAVALKIAQRHPARVKSVFAYEPVLFHLLEGRDDASAERLEIGGVSQRTTDSATSGDLEGAAEIFVRYWSGDRAWEALPPERREQLAAVAPKAACDFQAIDNETDAAAAYFPAGVEVRIASGALSPAPARKVAAILNEASPGALDVLPRVGHMAPITNPDVVLSALLRHWGRPLPDASSLGAG